MLNDTMPPREPVGPVSHWEDSLAPVRKMLTGNEMRSLCWEMPISASAPALSCWGCPKACELKLFSSSRRVEREGNLADAENVNFFWRGLEK